MQTLYYCTDIARYTCITLALRHFLTTKACIRDALKKDNQKKASLFLRYNTIKYYDGRKEVKFISLLVGVNTQTHTIIIIIIIIIIITIIIPGGPGMDHLHPAERGGALHRPRHPSQRHRRQDL